MGVNHAFGLAGGSARGDHECFVVSHRRSRTEIGRRRLVNDFRCPTGSSKVEAQGWRETLVEGKDRVALVPDARDVIDEFDGRREVDGDEPMHEYRLRVETVRH